MKNILLNTEARKHSDLEAVLNFSKKFFLA